MKKARLVLVISENTDDAEELSRLIEQRGIGNLELRYATDLREAQRAVRAERFTAIVAMETGYVEFCQQMVPELTAFGSWLDIIIASFGMFDPEEAPYGVLQYTGVGSAARDVVKAINYQNGLEAERRQNGLDARAGRQRGRAAQAGGAHAGYTC